MQSTQTKGLPFTAFLFFCFPLFPPPYHWISTVWPVTNPHLLYPCPQKTALRIKPVQLIHTEASRRWIVGIKTVPPTIVGHEPGPPDCA